jgi:hypothetical protein
MTEKQFNQSINTLYSYNNGGEYDALDNFLALHSISYLTTPHTFEHNDFSEQHHLHIV